MKSICNVYVHIRVYISLVLALKELFFLVFQVSVIAGNLDLADVIQRHKMDDVGKLFENISNYC